MVHLHFYILFKITFWPLSKLQPKESLRKALKNLNHLHFKSGVLIFKWSGVVGGSTVHCSYFLDHFRIVKPWAWEFWDMSLTIVFFMRRTEVPAKPEMWKAKFKWWYDFIFTHLHHFWCVLSVQIYIFETFCFWM